MAQRLKTIGVTGVLGLVALVVLIFFQGGYLQGAGCAVGVAMAAVGGICAARAVRRGARLPWATSAFCLMAVSYLLSACAAGLTLTTLTSAGTWCAVAGFALVVGAKGANRRPAEPCGTTGVSADGSKGADRSTAEPRGTKEAAAGSPKSALSHPTASCGGLEDAQVDGSKGAAWRAAMLRAVAWVGVAAAVLGVIGWACGVTPLIDGERLQFTFQYANAAGLWYAVTAIMCLLSRSRALRAALPCVLAALALTQSFGAFLSFVVVLLACVFAAALPAGRSTAACLADRPAAARPSDRPTATRPAGRSAAAGPAARPAAAHPAGWPAIARPGNWSSAARSAARPAAAHPADADAARMRPLTARGLLVFELQALVALAFAVTLWLTGGPVRAAAAFVLVAVCAVAYKLAPDAQVGPLSGLSRTSVRAACVAIAAVACVAGLVVCVVASGRVSAAWAHLVERLIQMGDAATLWATAPLLGVGPDNWQYLYPFVQTAQYHAATVHDSYLKVLVDAGIVGLACYVAAIVCGARNLVRARDAVALACVALVVLHGLVDFDARFTSIQFLLALLVCAPCAPGRRADSRTGERAPEDTPAQAQAVGNSRGRQKSPMGRGDRVPEDIQAGAQVGSKFRWRQKSPAGGGEHASEDTQAEVHTGEKPRGRRKLPAGGGDASAQQGGSSGGPARKGWALPFVVAGACGMLCLAMCLFGTMCSLVSLQATLAREAADPALAQSAFASNNLARADAGFREDYLIALCLAGDNEAAADVYGAYGAATDVQVLYAARAKFALGQTHEAQRILVDALLAQPGNCELFEAANSYFAVYGLSSDLEADYARAVQAANDLAHTGWASLIDQQQVVPYR